MLRKKYMLVCTINLLCFIAAHAQNKNSDVQGYIKNAQDRPITSASIYLLRASDSGLVKFTTSDKNGFFKFNNINPGSYLLSITSLGYISFLSPKFNFDGKLTLNVDVITLKAAVKDLAEVAVIGNSGLIETRTDKTILNIRNSNLSVGNNALEILSKSPGVQVDNNDNVSLNGRSDVLVMIDNKPTYLSGTALGDLLRGTQSTQIDKIELISNPNSTYDAAGTGGVINIGMVHNKNIGINVQATGGLGMAQFPGNNYSGFRSNAGINFNYRSKALNIFGGYTYSNSPVYRSIISDRLDLYNGQYDVIGSNMFINQRRQTNNLRIGADYNLTPRQSIGFLISDVIINQNGPKNTTSVISNNNVIDSTIVTSSSLKRWQSNTDYNINYQADMGKKGTLMFNGDYIKYKRNYDELFQSNYYYSYNTTLYRSLWLQNNSPLSYDIYVLSGNYHLDINTENNFTAGFKASKTKMDNTSTFGSIYNNVYKPYGGFTGEFNYSERINAAYFDYNHIFDKNTALEIGARLEQTAAQSTTSTLSQNVDYDNNYWGFFPNIKLNHIINKNNRWQLGYGRRIYRPKYEELNTIVLFSDQYTYQIGNQYLKPYYSNLIEFKHIYKDKFVGTLSFEAINGFSQVIYIQSDKDQIAILKKVNLGNRYNYTLNFLAPFTLTKWYGVDFNMDFKYQRFTGTSPGGNLDSGSPDVTFQAQQHFKLPLGLQADLGAYYETPTTFGIYRYKAEYYFFGSVNKSLFKKKGAINLNVDRIFNSDKNIITSHYQNLNLNSTQIDKFRTIMVSFSYKFGSQAIKAARKKSNDADEEQGRIN